MPTQDRRQEKGDAERTLPAAVTARSLTDRALNLQRDLAVVMDRSRDLLWLVRQRRAGRRWQPPSLFGGSGGEDEREHVGPTPGVPGHPHAAALTDKQIRKLVHRGLVRGTLPRRISALAIQAGPGEPLLPARVAAASLPDRCAVCGEPSTQVRYNVPNAPVAFHTRCRQRWEEAIG